MNTFQKLMTSGSRCQREIAGSLVDHISPGGETQSLSCLIHMRQLVERDFDGTVTQIETAVITIVETELRLPVLATSKFDIDDDGAVFNIDELNNMPRGPVYLDVPVWRQLPVRKSLPGHRRSMV